MKLTDSVPTPPLSKPWKGLKREEREEREDREERKERRGSLREGDFTFRPSFRR